LHERQEGQEKGAQAYPKRRRAYPGLVQ
jgi:hypothetical protein